MYSAMICGGRTLSRDETKYTTFSDHGDTIYGTVLSTLHPELPTTTLHSHSRPETATTRDDTGKQPAAAKTLSPAAEETAREMKDLEVLMATMSERIDKLTDENRALRKQTPVPPAHPLPPPSAPPLQP